MTPNALLEVLSELPQTWRKEKAIKTIRCRESGESPLTILGRASVRLISSYKASDPHAVGRTLGLSALDTILWIAAEGSVKDWQPMYDVVLRQKILTACKLPEDRFKR